MVVLVSGCEQLLSRAELFGSNEDNLAYRHKVVAEFSWGFEYPMIDSSVIVSSTVCSVLGCFITILAVSRAEGAYFR